MGELIREKDFEETVEEFVKEIENLEDKEKTIESGRLFWVGDAPGYTGLKFRGNKNGGVLSFWTYTDYLIDSEYDVLDISDIKEVIETFTEI